MAIDEIRFGELIASVQSLTVTVNNLRAELMGYSAQQREDSESLWIAHHDHKEKTLEYYNKVDDIANWVNGDGTPENKGAKKDLDGLKNLRTKLFAGLTTVAIGVSLVSHKAVEKISDWLGFFAKIFD